MRTILNILTFSVCVALVCGCKHSKKTVTDATIVTFDNPEPRPIVPGDYFSEIKFVVLEEGEDSFIRGVAQAELADSLLFVSDYEKLCAFGLDGRFVSKIGRNGRGPGEYVEISCFFVDKDNKTVTVVDNGTGHFIEYGFDGMHISSTEISIGSLSTVAMLAGDGKLLISNALISPNDDTYTLVDPKHPEWKDNFGTYAPLTAEGYGEKFAWHPMTHSGRSILFTMPLDNTIYEYSDGEFSEKYYIETPQKMPPKERMRPGTLEDGIFFRQVIQLVRDEGYFGGFRDIFEADDLIFISCTTPKGDIQGMFVMDKRSNTGEYLLLESHGPHFLRNPVYGFSASDGNTLVHFLPDMQVSYHKQLLEEDREGVWPDFAAALDSIAEDSGKQLMIVYELKN